MAEIITKEGKGLFIEMTCPGCGRVVTICTDDQKMAIQAKQDFEKRHRKCGAGLREG
jgi:ribosomal protein S27E